MERINLAQYPQIDDIVEKLIINVASTAGKWKWRTDEFCAGDYDTYPCLRGESSVYGLEILMVFPRDGKETYGDKFRFTFKGKNYFADVNLCNASVGLRCLEETLMMFYKHLQKLEEAKKENEKRGEAESKRQEWKEEGDKLARALEDL